IKPFNEPDQVFSALSAVAKLVRVAANQSQPPAAQFLVGTGGFLGGRRHPRGIELRAGIAQLDYYGVSGLFDRHAEPLPRVLHQSVVDNVAPTFLESERDAEDCLFRNLSLPTE